MSCLWLISVGVSDVQFPVWQQDDYGQWNRLFRFDTGRRGIRSLHKDLLALAESAGVIFPPDTPERLRPALARDLRLKFLREGNEFVAGIEVAKDIRNLGFQISRHGDVIPNEAEKKLPLYCPKLAPMVDVAADHLGEEPISVVVLNTRRNENSPDGPDEPVASGPLVAKFLSERLSLNWIDNGGKITPTLAIGASTWVDILVDDEAVEDPAVQRRVVERLTAVIRGASDQQDLQILATTSGGMPPLKPLIERVPAIYISQDKVKLLDNPERGGPAALVALDYDARVDEQETIRFYCAEALRQGDYVGAYGMARRNPESAWASHVRNLLGPLLELPGGPIRINGSAVHHLAVMACQAEASLAMGDVASALKRLATFLESSVWVLIERDARIREGNLTVDREQKFIIGDIGENNSLLPDNLIDYQFAGRYQHRVRGLLWRWPEWLKQETGQQQAAAGPLYNLRQAYQGKLNNYRNLLVHGSDSAVSARQFDEIKNCMSDIGLVNAVSKPFGSNFLAVNNVRQLLEALDCSPEPIKQQVHDLLNTVIKL